MKIKEWLSAFRLRTLFLSLSCIWAGVLVSGARHPLLAVFTFLTALFLQILSNLANDYGDSVHGADHAQRQGPGRAVQTGAISAVAMKKAMFLFAGLSLISGILLLICALPVIGLQAVIILFITGLLSIFAAIAYTNGKRPYGYAGLGDISVFIFFGLVAVCGSAYLQMGSLNKESVLLAIVFGCISVGVLNLNNMRDIHSDAMAGKKSIPVRMGSKRARYYHALVLLMATAALLLFLFDAQASILLLMACPVLLLLNLLAAWRVKEPRQYDPLLKWLSLSGFALVLLLQIFL